MKKTRFPLLLFVLFFTFLTKAQTPETLIDETTDAITNIDMVILPNPVVETGELQFTLTERVADVYIFITNGAGKVVSSLPIGETPAGKNRVFLNVANLQGFYFVGIEAGNQKGTCKMFVK